MTAETSHGWVPEDTLAHRLVLVRRHLGITQRVAAERCGLTFGEWQGIEDGRAVRSLDVKVSAISAALGVDRDWLIWGGPLAAAQVPARDLPHRRQDSGVRREGLAGRPGRSQSVTNTYSRRCVRNVPGVLRPPVRPLAPRRVARIGGSTPDLWRMPDMPGSHEYPILLLRHGRNLGVCQRVAA
jgi:hypothetical protein